MSSTSVSTREELSAKLLAVEDLSAKLLAAEELVQKLQKELAKAFAAAKGALGRMEQEFDTARLSRVVQEQQTRPIYDVPYGGYC